MSTATAENGWINTADSHHPAVLERAHHILVSTRYCTLSTCSCDGFPWVSPVFFCYDNALNLYWSSATASRHSQNIYQNQGRLAIAIYDSNAGRGQGQGLYFYGQATEVSAEQVGESMRLLFQRAGGDLLNRTEEDYLGSSSRRIYRFQPQEAWVTGERVAVGKQLVDTKVQLELADLIGLGL